MTFDTTPEIWERRYLVKLPSLDATSISFLRNHGTYITGDKKIDRGNANSWITTYLTIDRMVDYYQEGVSIALVKQEDAKLIYEAIESHLLAWSEHLKYGMNTGDAPISDLIAMDEFAGIVYPHAKRHISDEIINNTLGRRLQSRFGFTPMTFMKSPNTIVQEEKEPERTPFSDFLKARASLNGVD